MQGQRSLDDAIVPVVDFDDDAMLTDDELERKLQYRRCPSFEKSYLDGHLRILDKAIEDRVDAVVTEV